MRLAEAKEQAVEAIRSWGGRANGSGGTGSSTSPCLCIEGLTRGGSALFIGQVAKTLARPALVVTTGPQEAEALSEDLRFFVDRLDASDPLKRRVHLFPSWEVPLYEPLSPPPQVMADRFGALFHLLSGSAALVVTTPEALSQRLMPAATLALAVKRLSVGQEIAQEELVDLVSEWGYQRVPQVEDCGEFSLRGGIVDIAPAGYEQPIRIDFSGDTIETLRDFDPVTQCSVGRREEAIVLPVREYSLSALKAAGSRRAIEMRAAEVGMPRRERQRLIGALAAGMPPPGTEFLLPYFYPDGLGTIFDFLPPESIVWVEDPPRVGASLQQFAKRVHDQARQCEEEARMFSPPEKLFVEPGQPREFAARWPLIELEPLKSPGGEGVIDIACTSNTELASGQGRGETTLDRLFGALVEWRAERRRVLLVVQDEAQAKRLSRILDGRGVSSVSLPRSADLLNHADAGVFIIVGRLFQGFSLPADSWTCVSEREIFGERRRQAPRRRVQAGELLASMADLRPQDYVVHLDHGIGLYRGLTHLKVAGTEGDYLHLEYAGGDRLYLPVDRINMVQKYMSADGVVPALEKLGSGSWEKVKAKTRESILAMARELVEVHAAREVLQAPGYSRPDGYYEEFAARFPFEETPDQERAIDEVLADLEQAKPMDRLVCGDVGYGKTEVALRAAFIVVMEGSQVAVLVPTTVLARQHYETFCQRYAGYPVRIEMLSRFRSSGDNQRVLEGLESGAVDIVIGTHRLLQEGVTFRRLGLLVVDEEHRFGVAHKERIKKLKKTVDVLTLTATPIPRTLHMSLIGLRDLSVIETPPVDRLAIRTFVTRDDERVVREAVLRELRRGGQVFFVHNRVETIEVQAARLRSLLPEASVAVAHGQMKSRQLEKVMLSFLDGQTNLLICSAIIESGLDIPTANTIIINRADSFGLAQLYQLRGRVGRSHVRAYAYLLIPGEHLIGGEAQKRLIALQQLDELGGGFRLAAHDLEIRGAGNLLGRQQSGHIKAVGFELYTKMMTEAVREIRGEPSPVEVEPEIQLGVSAYIPPSFVEDVNQRLAVYKRLAAARSGDEIRMIGEELEDRFGSLPANVETLLELMDLRRMLKDNLITMLKRRGDQLVISFHPQARVDAAKVTRLVAERPEEFKLSPDLRLSFVPRKGDIGGLTEELGAILTSIS